MSDSTKLNLLMNYLVATMGNRKSAYKLGQYYLNGIGTAKNHTKGMAWIEKAADKGHPDALYISGLNALEYKQEDKSFSKHMDEYLMHTKGLISLTLAGIFGHLDAQMRLAVHHESENNIYRDLIEAASWYKLAAANNSSIAIKWLSNNRQYAKNTRAFNKPEIEMIRADMLSGSPVAVLQFAKAIFEGDFSNDVYADALRLLFRFGHWARIYPSMFDCLKTHKLYNSLAALAMTKYLTLPSVIALASCALSKPTLSSLAVLGEISISGTILKVEELASVLQVCLDAGAKKVLIPITSAAELGTVPSDLIGAFSLIFYSTPQEAVFKALGVE